MAREDVEVGADVLHVDGQVRDGLRAIDEHQRAGLVGHGHHLAHRIDGPQAVRDVVEGDQLGPRPEQDLVARLDEPALVVDGHELQVGVALLGQDLPGHQVGVVLELGQDDRVARRDVPPAPGVGHQVDGLGRVAHEDDLVPIGVQEARRRRPRRLVGGGGLLAGRVDAAMDVGRVPGEVALDGVDDDARLEACRRRVEVGQPPTVEVTLELREVGPDGDGIEGADDGHRDRQPQCVAPASTDSASASGRSCARSSS